MKKYIFGLFLSVLLTTFTPGGYAQEKQQITSSDYSNRKVEMADSFRGEGKIYVVVAVMVALLGVLIFYLVRMDIKLSNIEARVEEHLKSKDKTN